MMLPCRSILILFVLCSVGLVTTLRQSEKYPNPHCSFPPLDIAAQNIDVLGDREKSQVCSIPRPWSLCDVKGPADSVCKKIARTVGGTSNATCSHVKTCKFTVKHPIQHPNEPGDAYVSLCVPEFAGVIFPCIQNDLVIINPFFREVDNEEETNHTIDIKDLTESVLGTDICGKVDTSVKEFVYTTKKIVKPQKTVRGQFPWQIAFYRKDLDERSAYGLFCGGSVISKQHILTAAHCFEELDFDFKVVTGDFTNNVKDESEQEFFFDSKQIYPHQDYDQRFLNNDIAIVRIEGTIKFDVYTQPICLPSKTSDYFSGLDCLISGWGTNGSSILTANTLQAAQVPTLDGGECKKKDVYGEIFLERTMFCAGYLTGGGADTCQGDSGGPLVCERLDGNNRKHLIQYGVVAWGSGCGLENKPGVYTKISTYREWIDKTLQDSINNIAYIVDKKRVPRT